MALCQPTNSELLFYMETNAGVICFHLSFHLLHFTLFGLTRDACAEEYHAHRLLKLFSFPYFRRFSSFYLFLFPLSMIFVPFITK